MSVLIISQYYPPESSLLASILARELTEHGHQVRVLTGYPNYPTGRVFDGYRQQWRGYEQDGDVRVCRVRPHGIHLKESWPGLTAGPSMVGQRGLRRAADRPITRWSLTGGRHLSVGIGASATW